MFEILIIKLIIFKTERFDFFCFYFQQLVEKGCFFSVGILYSFLNIKFLCYTNVIIGGQLWWSG